MNTQPTICALYTRVSSRNQLEADYNSLQTQRERLEAYCRSQDNYQVFRVYEDGAYSAETLDRPALQEMLADIRAGKVNCVLAYKIDRLTRSVKDFHGLMEVFDRYGVKFVSVTQSIDTQNPMGRLLRNVLLDFAQFEREMTADRTRDKMLQRAQKGLWNGGPPPYGYTNQDKRLVPHPIEAPRVLFMFQQFAQDPSLARLRNNLDQRGWETRGGARWHKTVLSYMLRNPLYRGAITYQGQQYEGQHEALVDEALFARVQATHREATHVSTTMKRPFLLKGLLRCSDCASFMTPHYTQKRHKDGSVYRIPYYRCTRTLHFDTHTCRVKHLNADQAERSILQNLAELSQNPRYLQDCIEELNRDLKRKVEPLEQEAAGLKKRAQQLEAEIDRFVDALGKGSISISRLEKEMEHRQAQKAALEAQVADLQRRIQEHAAADFNADLVHRNLLDFQKVFHALTPQEQAEALQCMVKQVIAHPDKLVLEIYELADFQAGSTKDSKWLAR